MALKARPRVEKKKRKAVNAAAQMASAAAAAALQCSAVAKSRAGQVAAAHRDGTQEANVRRAREAAQAKRAAEVQAAAHVAAAEHERALAAIHARAMAVERERVATAERARVAAADAAAERERAAAAAERVQLAAAEAAVERERATAVAERKRFAAREAAALALRESALESAAAAEREWVAATAAAAAAAVAAVAEREQQDAEDAEEDSMLADDLFRLLTDELEENPQAPQLAPLVLRAAAAGARAAGAGATGAAPPDELMCSITSALMNDPVMCVDGNTYERRAISEWFGRGNTTSPLTNLELTSTVLLPNRSVKKMCDSWRSAQHGRSSRGGG